MLTEIALLPLAVTLAAPTSPEIRVLLESRAGEVRERSMVEFSTSTLTDVGAVWIRFTGDLELVEPQADRAEVELVSGDLLSGTVAGGEDETLELLLAGRLNIPLPIDVLRSVVFPERLPLGGRAAVTAPEEGDRLYRRIGDNLDRIDGAVLGFDPDGLDFETALGARTFAWREVGALFVEVFDESAADSGSDGTPVVCDLVDGGRLRGRLEVLDGKGCRLVGPAGTRLVVPIELLTQVSLDDGSIVFLSDLEPARAEEGSPFGDDLGMSWPHREDRSVLGDPLVVAGTRYDRGIGVHAPSRLTYALDGSWTELRGLVGIDDSVLRLPSRGSVRFRIVVDGEPVYESDVLRGGMAARELPDIPLEGARELTLECDMASEFAVADRANWLRMVLVREE